MHKKTLTRILALAALSLAATQPAEALPASTFAQQSRLSSGHWVRIAVDASGVYELTADELSAMGFADPTRVAVYGQGGHMLSEVLDGSAIDDLQPVATMMANGKLYFYGKGALNMSLNTNNSSELLAFSRELNAYSTKGYYFLTEESSPLRVQESTPGAGTASNWLSESYNYWYHERELCSVSHTGKDLLGEDMTHSELDIPFELPMVASPSITVAARCAVAHNGWKAYLVGNIVVNDVVNQVNFDLSKSGVFPLNTDQLERYKEIMPHKVVDLSELPTSGEFRLKVLPNAGTTINLARLDYALITYLRTNTFASATEPQFEMWYSDLKSNQVVAMPGCPAQTLVWDVTNAQTPVCYHSTMSDTTAAVAIGCQASVARFVAFDPAREQLKIAGHDEVAPQNLHGMAVPDMLIVAPTAYLEQAQRLALLHTEYDGMNVAVVDQQWVFNEFSSGTPDAMAVRLLCKMLYDRDPGKFKNLLMFGPGTYDNRQLTFTRPNSLITFETTVSYCESASYPSDDFFGILDDNTGIQPSRELLRIGVGRITAHSGAEAKSDVDKIVEYVTCPDYGVWRNNALLLADEADEGLHCFQTEGISNLLESNLNTGLHTNKTYVEFFPRSNDETLETNVLNRSCTEGRRHIIENLNAGQYFMTYVGHAGGSVFSGSSKLWRTTDVRSNHYNRWPIVSTACCNVARFDANSIGIAEAMLHERNGGAIALLTSARDVVSENNDALNRAFVNQLFSAGASGAMPTLGEVYMKTKQSFGSTITDHNKMSFLLLGDPALKVNYPRPLFSITRVNGTTVGTDSIAVAPLQRVVVEADVLTPTLDGTDTSFDGEAILTLYGAKRYHTSYQSSVGLWYETRKIYHERPLLAQVHGTVTAGHFVGELIVPRNEQVSTDSGMALAVYAHKSGTTHMVNGTFESLQLTLTPDEGSQLVDDDTAPVIESMYLNDATTFAQDATVASTAMLYVHVTDDNGLNIQHNVPGATMRLTLDVNKSTFYTVKDYARCSDGGRQMDIAFPLYGLTPGRHSLTFRMQDMCGNEAQQTITFVVGNIDGLALDVAERPASHHATINIARNDLGTTPEVALKVTDAQGRLVWTTTTNQFPVSWDLTDATGRRVPAGLYKYYGSYRSGSTHGGTAINDIVVIDPLHAAAQ